jgi:DNA-binding PadR family transcriptional regulator
MAVPIPDETILGLLAAHPQHGYQLLARFESRADLGRVWTMSTSQLYAVLKRLEGSGLIRGKEVLTAYAPPRREYAITAAGRRSLDAWLQETKLSSSIRQVRVQFISRIYVARLLGLSTSRLVDRQRKACEVQREKLLAVQSKASSQMEVLVLDFVISQLDAVLDWFDRCEESLPELTLA